MGKTSPELGYMASYEWMGKGYDVRATPSSAAVTWLSRGDLAPSFREAWRCAHALQSGDKQRSESSVCADDVLGEANAAGLGKAIRVGVTEAFC